MEIIAKTFYGFEDILAEEIKQLGGTEIEIGNRAIRYEGSLRLLYESNLCLRTAISVISPIKKFSFRDQDDFKRKLSGIEFNRYMHVGNTFAVKGAIHTEHFSHSKYPILLVKDAIADFFRNSVGHRPSVSVGEPQIQFDVHINGDLCTLALNSSGTSLFQRGYRVDSGPAPLNEAIAAGLILMSGWDRKSNFVDLFCGSGTIPIEAALIANEIPPNIARKYYSFQYWPDFDRQMWQDILDKANHRPKRDLDFKIIGSDTSTDMIRIARDNARALPLGKTLVFEAKDYRDQTIPSGGGVMISNPPYGKRFAEGDNDGFFAALGTFLKKRMLGYHCWILSSHSEAMTAIGLKHTENINIYDGGMDCEFRKYSIFEGSLKEHKTDKANESKQSAE